MWSTTSDAGDLQVRFDERDVETELRRGYSGTARRKGRTQTNRTYRHRATSRLYRFVYRSTWPRSAQSTARLGCRTMLAALLYPSALPCHAQTMVLPPVEIKGSYEDAIGTWDAASQGAATEEVIGKRPL